jgi:hypothetical protein
MKSTALIPLIVLMVAYSAQAAEKSYPTDPPVSHFQGSCDSDPDGTKFAKRACYTSFDPEYAPFGPSYRPPICNKKPVTELQRELWLDLPKVPGLPGVFGRVQIGRRALAFTSLFLSGSWGREPRSRLRTLKTKS